MEFSIENDESKMYIKQFKSGPIDIVLSIVTGAKLDLQGDTAQKNFKLIDCTL